MYMKKAIELFQKIAEGGANMFLLVEKLNDDAEQARRLSICEANAGGCYKEETDQCSECLCFMKVKTGMLKHRNVKAQLRVEVTHCPLAKWGGVDELEIVNHYRRIDGKEILTLN
jgi:hypothetical protein